MSSSVSQPTVPRWKAIRDQLFLELPGYEYGSSFYTIDDICRKFDVSIITARRVLDELASEGLVEKIRKRGTVVRRTSANTVIRLVMAADSPTGGIEKFSVTVQRQLTGLIQFAHQHHLDFDTLSEAHLELLFAREHKHVGLLLRPNIAARTLDFVRARGLPHVMLDPIENWRQVSHARADRRQAGYLGAKHLIELGHRRIGFILGPITQRNFRDRVRGYRAALHEAGIAFDWSLLKETDGIHLDQDEAAATELLSLRQRPTAIMTGSDPRALTVLQVARRRGLRVPQDLSVLAYPGYPESKLCDPPLSIIDGRYEEVSQAAMRLLLTQMHEGGSSRRQSVLIEPRFLARQSTAPAPDIASANPSTSPTGPIA